MVSRYIADGPGLLSNNSVLRRNGFEGISRGPNIPRQKGKY